MIQTILHLRLLYSVFLIMWQPSTLLGAETYFAARTALCLVTDDIGRNVENWLSNDTMGSLLQVLGPVLNSILNKMQPLISLKNWTYRMLPSQLARYLQAQLQTMDTMHNRNV